MSATRRDFLTWAAVAALAPSVAARTRGAHPPRPVSDAPPARLALPSVSGLVQVVLLNGPYPHRCVCRNLADMPLARALETRFTGYRRLNAKARVSYSEDHDRLEFYLEPLAWTSAGGDLNDRVAAFLLARSDGVCIGAGTIDPPVWTNGDDLTLSWDHHLAAKVYL